jgi:hypothetical protein
MVIYKGKDSNSFAVQQKSDKKIEKKGFLSDTSQMFL